MREKEEIQELLDKVIDTDRAYETGSRQSIIREVLDWVLEDSDEEPSY